jgi:hypothetical protein
MGLLERGSGFLSRNARTLALIAVLGAARYLSVSKWSETPEAQTAVWILGELAKVVGLG